DGVRLTNADIAAQDRRSFITQRAAVVRPGDRRMIRISRRFFTGAALAAVSSAALTRAGLAQSEPALIGVSGPLTGANAQYGLQWKQGFDLALDKINAEGGVKGR